MNIWSLTVDGYEPLVNAERKDVLQAVVDGLPGDIGQLLKQRYYDQVKPGEIAIANGICVQDLRNAIRRALRRLRKELTKDGIHHFSLL